MRRESAGRTLFYKRGIAAPDLFATFLICIVAVWLMIPVISAGTPDFSDVEIGPSTRGLLREGMTTWNGRLGSPNSPGLARLLALAVPWLISWVAGFDVVAFRSSALLLVALGAAFSMFGLARYFLLRMLSRPLRMPEALALASASILYLANPWFLLHTDRLFVLCAHAMMPLFFLMLLRAFPIGPGTNEKRIGDSPISSRPILDLGVLSLVAALLTLSPSLALACWALGLLIIVAALIRALVYPVARGLRATATIGKFAVMVGLFFGFSWFWIGPAAAGDATARIFSSPIPDAETLAGSSQHATILRALLLMSDSRYHWSQFGILAGLGGAVVVIVVGFGTVRLPKQWIVLAPVGFVILSLSMGTRSFVSARWYHELARSSHVAATLLSDPTIFGGLIVVAYAPLFGSGVSGILMLRGGPFVSVVVRPVLLVAAAVAIWLFVQPVLIDLEAGSPHLARTGGRTNGPMEESRRPLEYRTANESEGVERRNTSDRPGIDDVSETLAPAMVRDTQATGPPSPASRTYFARFAEDLLSRGATRRFPKYLASLGVDRISFSSRNSPNQTPYEELLSLQDGWDSSVRFLGSVSYSIVADREGIPVSPLLVYSSGGLHTLPAMEILSEATANRFDHVYSHSRGEVSIGSVQPGDLVAADSFDELWLSNLQPEYYIDPAEWASASTPYVGWISTRIDGDEWSHLLAEQDLAHPYDLDMGSGLAATYASTAFSDPRFDRAPREGDLVVEDSAMKRLGIFFEPVGSDRRPVAPYPISGSANFRRIPSEARGGRPSEPVAVSGAVEIAESRLYRFELTVSGDGADSLVLRFHFLDSSHRAVGPVIPHSLPGAAPGRFTLDGELSAPPLAKFLRVTLESPEPPRASLPSRWWIHRFALFDLQRHQGSNSIGGRFVAPGSGTHKAFARTFHSPKGGDLEVRLGGSAFLISTLTSRETGFVWRELGEVALEAEAELEIENRSGLNAVNRIALIPVDDLEVSRFPVRRAIRIGAPFFSLEAERSFDFEGNLQTSRSYPDLSSGAGIVAADGLLRKRIELLEEGPYRIVVRQAGNRDRSVVTLLLRDVETGQEISRRSNFRAVVPTTAARPYVDGDVVSMQRGGLPDLQLVTLDPMRLRAGSYDLEIRTRSRTPNLATIYGLRPFDPGSIAAGPHRIVDADRGCSTCERVDATMMRHSYRDGILIVSYAPGCSCDWYVYSTPAIGVVAGDEYLIRFDARSVHLRGRHGKVLFLDASNRLIGSDEMPSSIQPGEWTSHEYLVSAPNGASRMMFQVWGRGDRTRSGLLEMASLSILPYKELPLIDVVYVLHEDALDALDRRAEARDYQIAVSRDGMLRRAQVDDSAYGQTIFQFDLPYGEHWKPRSLGLRLAVNGTQVGFASFERDIEIVAGCRRCYYVGLALFSLSVVTVVAAYCLTRYHKAVHRLVVRWYAWLGRSRSSR